jgi:hypothetical protein
MNEQQRSVFWRIYKNRSYVKSYLPNTDPQSTFPGKRLYMLKKIIDVLIDLIWQKNSIQQSENLRWIILP